MLYVVVIAYERPVPLRIMVDCIMMQTFHEWDLTVVHDGVASQAVMNVMNEYKDPRIHFLETAQRRGLWGHPNRRMMIENLPTSTKDFLLITNDDNYYVPEFMSQMMYETQRQPNVGMVHCDVVHNYFKYGVLSTRPAPGRIDMGCFITRLDVAKEVGFDRCDDPVADGYFAQNCAQLCQNISLKIIHISRPLFVHN